MIFPQQDSDEGGITAVSRDTAVAVAIGARSHHTYTEEVEIYGQREKYHPVATFGGKWRRA